MALTWREALVADETEFCILGPLLVRHAGVIVPVPPGKQRALLAALLLSAGRVVQLDELAQVLWGSAPPPSARASLQNHVMRLRKSLAAAGDRRIVTQPDGYLIKVAVGELDLDRFESSVAAARAANRAGSWADTAAALRAALALWRGQPLAGVRSDALTLRELPRLAEMRLQALESRIDADLHLGRPSDVIIELKQLVAENPLRETLHGLLMLALYRHGQQAGALAAYQVARRVLISELGTEPGRELRQLHNQMLNADPVLAARDHGDAGSPGLAAPARRQQSGLVVPRQLPATVAYFAGRVVELAELTALLARAAGAGGTVVISAIGGTAGVGKTALALHWAHQVVGQFPDGQLHVNLRGFGPAGPPLTATEGIRLLLDGLGVAPERIPAAPDAQAALYRSLLAGRRMLVMLDNARDAAQIRPLLPGGPGCLVLVTSRNQLTGLAAADGALLLTLGVLTESEARELLARRLGAGRVAAEPAAVTELTGLCARLPLALSIAAAHAAVRPDLPLAELAAGLRERSARLDVLGTGDAATDLRTVLSWSYQQLSGAGARMFRLLSVHPGPDITILAAASLAAVAPDQARRALAELASAHLLAEHAQGRYGCHDLLRAYAAEQARATEGVRARRAALHRVLDHYLHTGYAAALLLNPTRDRITLKQPQPQVRPEDLADRRAALDWFLAELRVLLAVIAQAAGEQFRTHAWQLPWTVATFLNWQGYWAELVTSQESALAAACQLGDLTGQSEAHRYLGQAQIRFGACAEASVHLTAAIELFRQLGKGAAEARAHFDLAHICELQGRASDALGHAEQSLRLYRAAAHRAGEANALNAVGWSHAQLGAHQEALGYCGQALALNRELDNRTGKAATLDSLGYVHHKLGQHAEAISCYLQALETFGDTDDLQMRAEALARLGDAHQAAGDHGAARRSRQQALALLDDLHDPGAAKLRSLLRHRAECVQPALEDT
jgi:DNA-binding SARP family transcriptional activator/tetratricopeptide (TPR) repeat protein